MTDPREKIRQIILDSYENKKLPSGVLRKIYKIIDDDDEWREDGEKQGTQSEEVYGDDDDEGEGGEEEENEGGLLDFFIDLLPEDK